VVQFHGSVLPGNRFKVAFLLPPGASSSCNKFCFAGYRSHVLKSYFRLAFEMGGTLMKSLMNKKTLWPIAAILCLGGSTRAEESHDGFDPLFDGKSLAGWREAPKGKVVAWAVKDGVIRGEGKENRQVYLIYTGDEALEDFELKFSYRMLTKGNTGVELRARVDKTGKRDFEGYHADLGHVGIGDGVLGAWDFHFGQDTRQEFPCQRGTRLVIDKKGKGHHDKITNSVQVDEIKKDDWNACQIVARGNHFQFFINGKLSSEFTDKLDGKQLTKGFIGLQLHDKGMVVEFKDLFLKKGKP
jgi:hypothetical protein|tara:strand:- start:5915 stop:6811 length:897 start_codon:yes stop_codon:yes gene_type:complete